jgi:hypothetical protein
MLPRLWMSALVDVEDEGHGKPNGPGAAGGTLLFDRRSGLIEHARKKSLNICRLPRMKGVENVYSLWLIERPINPSMEKHCCASTQPNVFVILLTTRLPHRTQSVVTA